MFRKALLAASLGILTASAFSLPAAAQDYVVGVTAGLTNSLGVAGALASPLFLGVVVDGLADRGYADVDEVTSAAETLTFALPPELRRDLAPSTDR